MGEIKEKWQPSKFYCSEIKFIYSTSYLLKQIRIVFFETNLPPPQPLQSLSG